MNKRKVLVVEDGHKQQIEMARLVTDAGYEALVSTTGTSLADFYRSRPDAAIAGVDAAGNGWQAVERLRQTSEVPIVLYAAKATNDALHRCFDLHADGFLLRPFTTDDLARCLDTVSEKPDTNTTDRYERHGLRIDWASCAVSVDGRPVELTRTEFRLLKFLIEQEGRVLSHDQILSEVWGPEYTGDKDRVKLYVWYLRRKIESDPCQPDLVVTKRGYGYSFVS